MFDVTLTDWPLEWLDMVEECGAATPYVEGIDELQI